MSYFNFDVDSQFSILCSIFHFLDSFAELVAWIHLQALALLQRRVLRQLRMEQVDGRDCMVLAQKGHPEAPPRQVIRPLLTEDDVARIASELAEVLDGEL